jgi:hypothetical protein
MNQNKSAKFINQLWKMKSLLQSSTKFQSPIWLELVGQSGRPADEISIQATRPPLGQNPATTDERSQENTRFELL